MCIECNYMQRIGNENNVVYLDSPIGFIEIQSNEGKIISLNFVEEKKYKEKFCPILEEAKRQLKEYFNRQRKEFNLPIKLKGTDFQKKVWNELIKIPYGKTCSYKDIAKRIGNKNASRAVGNANNKNKIAIIIPCHRVVGSDGRLVGYEAGLWRKKWLLEHEKSL
ncbi:methylated-DNA--[protein]-cysteine S-methyltransferase [Caminicella sporogenes]|uniref:methylated-DNA--[protein]-cysteine S-methyltransferase n=1 Tax=Caminicella sporogenes TaxID=166485 RepID=UPI00254116AE|nr:methylated-DNA--[protein]-cysteine S-methyltransferase [Caminicella sporogenes]WIF94192.1 methylated-DNA--[protein]-cysteine S-methyltransferase [Caminicella sporogenes]